MYYNEQIMSVLNYDFSPSECKYSSGKRELLSVKVFLEYCKLQNKKFETNIVYWQTDSSVAYFFLLHGSRNPNNYELILNIKLLERSLNIRIIPIWTNRDHPRIVLADLGSKSDRDTDEFGLSDDMILYICNYFKVEPEIDGLAIEINKKFDIYFSKYPQSKSSGVNFFAQPYRDQKIYYLHPPVNLIVYVVKWIENRKSFKGILIIPFWQSSNFWCSIHNGKTFKEQITSFLFFDAKLKVYHNQSTKNMINPLNSMKMIALLYDF